MSLLIDLTDRRAAVSGVTSGIGAGIARALAAAGCHVAGCGLEPLESDGARQFIEDVRAENRNAWYFPIDLSVRENPAVFVEQAAEKMGRLDLLVSNAGRNFFEGAAECSEDEWSACLELDLSAHWRLAKAAKPHLENSSDPVIIIISSNHAFATIPNCFPYNVAKAGLTALTQSLAIEWGPKIRSVAIAPGFIDTPGNDKWFLSFDDPAAERRRTEDLHPVGRLGSVEEIGSMCAFLASSWAAFISGVTLVVDGGRSALLQDAAK